MHIGPLKYEQVYDFTNENVACLKKLYNFNNSKVITVAGSGDQYFTSILNGAKQVDLVDVNSVSYLYIILKFYSIRELSYEEFYDFLILKNFDNIKVYEKLESQLPIEVLKYYMYLLINNKKNFKKYLFKCDKVDLLSKKNQKYYLNNKNTVIPYLYKENYYKLQELLKHTQLPNFFNCDIRNLKSNINSKYDIMLLSNIYNHLHIKIDEYTKLIRDFDIPEVEAHYDWYGFDISEFSNRDFSIRVVSPASPSQYNKSKNYVFSLKR